MGGRREGKGGRRGTCSKVLGGIDAPGEVTPLSGHFWFVDDVISRATSGSVQEFTMELDTRQSLTVARPAIPLAAC